MRDHFYYIVNFQVKQYVLQRLHHESDKDEKFEKRVQKLLHQHRHVNNYNVLGQKGKYKKKDNIFIMYILYFEIIII